MKYHGYLLLVLTTLASSVLIENRNLFSSAFFTVAYITMSIVLVIGTKFRESQRIDILLGLLLMFSVAFLSTETIIYIIQSRIYQISFFKLEVIASLDYCAICFLRSSREFGKMRKVEKQIE